MLEDWHNASQEFSAGLLSPETSIPSSIIGWDTGKATKRFAVYRNNVTLSLISALEKNFPAIRRLVGEEFFAAMARIFVTNHPPHSRLLAEYGGGFPAFLESFEPLAAYRYMSDVARLERAWLDVYHEEDAPALDGAVLGAMAPDRLFETRFIAHPAARLMTFNFAAVSIMSANRAAGDVPAINPNQSEYGLLTRPQLSVVLRHVTPSTYMFLSVLLGGHSLGEAARQAQDAHQDFDLATNIQGVLEAGVFTAIQS